METSWHWGAEPKRKGSEGFNDAGILTFNSHVINSFIRELFQNSNDAKVKGVNKVRIRIQHTYIAKEDIPAFKEYSTIFHKVEESNSQQKKFFLKAFESLDKPKVECLIYSDYNTTGLSGTEEDADSSFIACILSEGISAKNNKTAGGSFGIGKSAIYGISNLRTVLFSSLNQSGEHIFQGVAKLASYKIDGLNHEGRVYLGEGTDRISVRDFNKIPPVFRRDTPGLSQFILGVAMGEGWKKDFTKAILRNYWQLLLEDGLEVELIDEKGISLINYENLLELMTESFSEEEEEFNLQPYGNPLMFCEAFQNGVKRIFEIPFIGKCVFHYLESEKGENNIAYIRNGMVVFTQIEKRLVGANVTGVFYCQSIEGNEILRLMEPPKHDSFEPQMLENKHEKLSKKDGDLILNKTKFEIRLVIKNLIAKYKKETETPPFLVEFFEDIEKGFATSDKGIKQNQKSEIETLYKTAKEEVLDIILDSESNGSFSNTPTGVTVPGGTSGGKKGNNPRKGGTSSGNKGKNGQVKNYPVYSRVFLYEEDVNRRVYKAVVQSDISLKNVELNLTQYGDSGSDIAFTLNQVTDDEGNLITFREIKDSDGLVSEYKIIFDLDKSKTFYLDILDNQRSAFILN
jgi:hypothetical protein